MYIYIYIDVARSSVAHHRKHWGNMLNFSFTEKRNPIISRQNWPDPDYCTHTHIYIYHIHINVRVFSSIMG